MSFHKTRLAFNTVNVFCLARSAAVLLKTRAPTSKMGDVDATVYQSNQNEEVERHIRRIEMSGLFSFPFLYAYVHMYTPLCSPRFLCALSFYTFLLLTWNGSNGVAMSYRRRVQDTVLSCCSLALVAQSNKAESRRFVAATACERGFFFSLPLSAI